MLVTNVADIPQLALLHHRDKSTTHATKADNANAKLTIHNIFGTPEVSILSCTSADSKRSGVWQ